MDLAAQLTAHLRALTGQADAADDHMREVAARLAALAQALAAEVPSCLSVSIVLSRPAGDVTVAGRSLTDAGAAVVQASLAIPLDTTAGDAVLLLQAGHPGAFVLLADDLTAQRHPHRLPLRVDQHLGLLLDPDRLASELADLRVLEQAVGALIGQGWLPAQARQELDDRARDAQLSAPGLARQLLAALPGPGTHTAP